MSPVEDGEMETHELFSTDAAHRLQQIREGSIAQPDRVNAEID